MKIVNAFLFVALSCYFGSGDTSFVGSGGVKQVLSNVPMIPKECLENIIKVDVPQTLHRLQELLCLYMKGRKTLNVELYKQFILKVHTALIDAGCSADKILSTPNYLEKVGDQVAKVAKQLELEILETVGEPLESLSQSQMPVFFLNNERRIKKSNSIIHKAI